MYKSCSVEDETYWICFVNAFYEKACRRAEPMDLIDKILQLVLCVVIYNINTCREDGYENNVGSCEGENWSMIKDVPTCCLCQILKRRWLSEMAYKFAEINNVFSEILSSSDLV